MDINENIKKNLKITKRQEMFSFLKEALMVDCKTQLLEFNSAAVQVLHQILV